ncbi:LysM peptidoglycan-binding domain-containing protein [uncultured Sphingomonas sp.]|uniref:LysM peptidoglycan-binding domain-containing protein n=1 Tax=uncultured Sphingomonas sp. TaxID=158754 RepID=UPI0035CCA544
MTIGNAVATTVGNREVRRSAGPGAGRTSAVSLDRHLAAASPLARFGSSPGSSYVVKAGDTLDRIARAHGTTWQTLARINGIADPDRIFPGQAVMLPTGASTSHTVRRGDTLGAIAAANGTTVGALARINGLTNPDRIFSGQTIRIGGAPSSAGTSAPAAGAERVAAPRTGAPAASATDHRLGGLSEVYESGNRGSGTVSPGTNDPGGVSYGVYQLSTKAGTMQSFMRNEGARWAGELAGAPGSRTFSDGWRAIAAREPEAFRAAQHSFIQRTHYEPALAAVAGRTGLDLNGRHSAVRDAA